MLEVICELPVMELTFSVCRLFLLPHFAGGVETREDKQEEQRERETAEGRER